jgi:hypothetical protein
MQIDIYDPVLTNKQITDMQKAGFTDFAPKIMATFLIIYATVLFKNAIPENVYQKAMGYLQKMGGRFTKLGKVAVKNPFATTAVVVAVANPGDTIDGLKGLAKFLPIALGGFILFKIFK